MKYRDILENLVTLPDEWRGLKFEGGKSLIKVWLETIKMTQDYEPLPESECL